MQGRYLPANDYRALKAATRDLVAACGGSTRAAEITRLDQGSISRSGNLHERQYLPIDVVADLEAECGDPIVSRFLVGLCNHDAVPRGGPSPRPADHIRALGELSREVADVMQAQSVAAADGVIDAQESEEILKELDDVYQVISAMRAAHRRNAASASLREVK